MSQPQVYGNYSFKIEELNGQQGLKFFQADLPGGDVQISNVKAYSEGGPAMPLSGGGHQATWKPVTLTRYIDESTVLWDWYAAVIEKGAIDGDTKQETKITCLNNDQPLFMWTLTGAVPTSYSHNAANAQNHDLMTETVTITYETAKLSRS